MSWFADLAGKAENLLINLDEQTGAALRNKNAFTKKRYDANRIDNSSHTQKKRPIPRSLKTITGARPPSMQSSMLHPKDVNGIPVATTKSKMKSTAKKKYLDYSPRSLDEKKLDATEAYGYKPRRFSLPGNLEDMTNEGWANRLETLDIENAMLKNELNVTNREIKELIDRLQITENDLNKTKNLLDTLDITHRKTIIDKETLIKQVETLKAQLADTANVELAKHREQKRELQSEISVLRERNRHLEELVNMYDLQIKDTCSIQNKKDNDLRHAHSTINMLQCDLNKTKDECKRLEKEWEAYKHRVKSMLTAKDKEIYALQQGTNVTEDTKILVEQLENLKEERVVLAEAVTKVRGECGDMKQYMESLENRHSATERVVVALREALKDERNARISAETAFNNISQELKTLQIESGQLTVNLRTALREKENELAKLRETTFTNSSSSVSSSAINVADFEPGGSHYSEDSQKLHYLSHKLVQRQGKIDILTAENNILKIQLEKLENKMKNERSPFARGKSSQSVVNCHVGGFRSRDVHSTTSFTEKMSRWVGVLLRSHPLFRTFIVIYMICLHIWVFTVLLTSTPDSKGSYYYRSQEISPN